MRKLTAFILLASFVVIIISSLSSCKARKVAVRTLDSTGVHHEQTNVSTKEAHVDTSKSSSTKVTDQKTITITNDSTHTKTTITPTPGTQSTIDPDGTFHGQASSVITDHKSGSKKKEKIDSNIQEAAGEIKGITDTKAEDKSKNTSDSTHVKSKVKTVDAKPSYGAWPWVIGIVIVICLMVLLWWFLGKPRGLKTN